MPAGRIGDGAVDRTDDVAQRLEAERAAASSQIATISPRRLLGDQRWCSSKIVERI